MTISHLDDAFFSSQKNPVVSVRAMTGDGSGGQEESGMGGEDQAPSGNHGRGQPGPSSRYNGRSGKREGLCAFLVSPGFRR